MPKLTGFWQTSNGYTMGCQTHTPLPHMSTIPLSSASTKASSKVCFFACKQEFSFKKRKSHQSKKQLLFCAFEWRWHHFCFRGADGFILFHRSYDIVCTNGPRLQKKTFSCILTECFWSIWSQRNISIVSDMCHSLNNTLVSTNDMYGKC